MVSNNNNKRFDFQYECSPEQLEALLKLARIKDQSIEELILGAIDRFIIEEQATMPEQKMDAPEWGNAEEVERLFGFSRGTLYKLADAGRVESALIKTRDGARKGVRLFKIESIRRLLAANTLL